MNCRELEAIIDRYLDRELSAGEARTVEEHLSACPECREEYGVLIDFLSPTHEPAVQAGLRDRIVGSAVASQGRPSGRTIRWSYRIAAAAASIALLLTAWRLMPSSNETNTPADQPQLAVSSSPKPISPWLVSSLLQNASMPGLINPAVAVAQAAIMEDLTQRLYEEPEPVLPLRFCCTHQEIPEPPPPFEALEFAVFSSFYKL
jgi:hypothetical protein